MFNHSLTFFFFSLILSFSALANNPFAKADTIDIDQNVRWKLDKKSGVATKSIMGEAGVYYHLRFDNKQLEVIVSQDANGVLVKKFDQLDIKDVKIDGMQCPLFTWCLDNQESQDRFLQQGLKVKNNVCVSDGSQGNFVMQLDGGTLESLKNGRELSIVLKPYRTPLELHYELADFNNMVVALNTSPAPPVIVNAATPEEKCFSNPPAKYKSIRSIEYSCASREAKNSADKKVTVLVNRQKSLEVEQRKIAQEKKRQQQAAAQAQAEKEAIAQETKLKQEEKIQAEVAAVAASEAKQAEIGGEITQKMVSLCEKYWNKGEHRCYCQKYIEYAPSEIQSNSTCQ